LVVQQASDYSSAYGQHCDGILGFEALKHMVFTIDFQRKKFVFHPSTYDISKKVPDNKKTFLQKLLPIGHSSLEMQVSTPAGKTMNLALDTGNSFYATTHRDVLERVGLWEPNKPHKFSKLSGVASGTVESWTVKMPELKIFGVPTPPSVWDIIDLPSSSAEGDGTVGFGFLKNFNVTVDYDRRRVWLENFQGPINNEELGDVGISAGYDPSIKRTIIYRVAPDSPAAAAGIKEGDHVLMIDGEDLVKVGFLRFRTLMEGKVGSTVRLAISQKGALKRVELKREALVNVANG
ncbi:MAG: PDZ domain-containing protein, partial [Verrucomicrobiaceae bacterium]